MESGRSSSRSSACDCCDIVDLRAPARRGLAWASLSCVGAAWASAQLAGQATDVVHHALFAMLAGGLGFAAAVLLVVRIGMRVRRSGL